jgi:ferritin-like metal-binding protein YciE
MQQTKELPPDFKHNLKKLIELDYDAMEAYEVAISRLENPGYKSMFEEFKLDHQRHISEISKVLKLYNDTPPKGPSIKGLLTQGKVVLANLIGDRAILHAMRSNEIDLNVAYTRINNYEEAPETIKRTLKQGLQDERCHLTWIDEKLK